MPDPTDAGPSEDPIDNHDQDGTTILYSLEKSKAWVSSTHSWADLRRAEDAADEMWCGEHDRYEHSSGACEDAFDSDAVSWLVPKEDGNGA